MFSPFNAFMKFNSGRLVSYFINHNETSKEQKYKKNPMIHVFPKHAVYIHWPATTNHSKRSKDKSDFLLSSHSTLTRQKSKNLPKIIYIIQPPLGSPPL
jgi:hypothetical protein